MGKGGCMLMAADMAIQTVRMILGCACCLVITGPLLLIIGAMMLFGPNNRAANVASFNAAIIAYQPEITKLGNTWVSADSYNMSYITRSVTVNGNTDDVNPATSYLFSTSLSATAQHNFLAYTKNFSGNPASFSATPQSSGTSRSTTVSCTSSSGCSYSQMQSKCNAAAGACVGSLDYNSGCSGSCSRTCSWSIYISSVCWQMTDSGNGFAGTNQACTYPFTTAQPTSCSYNYNVNVEVRAASDPYIALQRLTSGTENFGLTEAQQRAIGLGLIAVGALFVVGLIGLCVAIRGFCSNDANKAQVYGAFGRQYQPVGGGGYQQMPPQQQYPQGHHHHKQEPQYPPQQQYPQGHHHHKQEPQYPPQQQYPGQYPGQPQSGYQQYPPPPQPYYPQQQYGQPQPAYGQPPQY